MPAVANNPKQLIAKHDVAVRAWLIPPHKTYREHNRVPLPFLIVTNRAD
jgi:hypothetical protein